jgi:hypothetical protein
MSDAPIAYERPDGALAIRASALGRCVRALWAVLDGIEPVASPEWLNQSAEEGHLHEGAVRDKLREQGWLIEDDQDTVELWVVPKKVVIVGHIDGWGVPPNHMAGLDDHLVEIKSMSRNVFDQWMKNRFEYRPSYAWQISAYMLAKGWPDEFTKCLYVSKRRDDGTIDEWVFDEPPYDLKAIRHKALAVLKAWKTGEMPDCDLPPDQRFPCPVFFLHDEDPETQEELEMMVSRDLDDVAAEYIEVITAHNELGARRKELKGLLEGYRDERDAWQTEHHTFRIAKNPGRKTFDEAKMRAAGVEVDQFMKQGKPIERWYVRQKDTTKGDE